MLVCVRDPDEVSLGCAQRGWDLEETVTSETKLMGGGGNPFLPSLRFSILPASPMMGREREPTGVGLTNVRCSLYPGGRPRAERWRVCHQRILPPKLQSAPPLHVPAPHCMYLYVLLDTCLPSENMGYPRPVFWSLLSCSKLL